MSDLHADVAQLVEHHLAKVRVAGSNPVVRSEVPGAVSPVFMTLRGQGPCGSAGTLAGPLERRPVAEWPSGLGKGLQSPVRGFDSRFRLCGRLAQRESASLTRKRSLVQSQYRPPQFRQVRGSSVASASSACALAEVGGSKRGASHYADLVSLCLSIPDVVFEIWMLRRGVRSADVSRSSRSFVGG